MGNISNVGIQYSLKLVLFVICTSMTIQINNIVNMFILRPYTNIMYCMYCRKIIFLCRLRLFCSYIFSEISPKLHMNSKGQYNDHPLVTGYKSYEMASSICCITRHSLPRISPYQLSNKTTTHRIFYRKRSSISQYLTWANPCSNRAGIHTLIARFMGPTWGPSGADRTQVGPMLAP